MTFLISIRDIDNIMHYIFDYVVISCYINDYLSNNNRMSITNKFDVEIHFVNDLKTNLLIDNDVFIAQRVKIDLITQNIQLSNCQNLVVSIDTMIKKNSDFKRTIRLILSSWYLLVITITCRITKIFCSSHNALNNDF